ncbi:MAG: NAD(P)H-dependent oxidoreductase subunit E, partial [Candidatus Marinimicrobia bacterium]|nr:NAD(P)H-dependent oxidoreductase subunit E [Candidatus Neomarinimicrobiota bacterium]
RAWVYFGIADYVEAAESADRILNVAITSKNQALESRTLAMRGFFEYYDHDFETALKMGAWEHERGLRATYCILHTAWYYGKVSQDGKISLVKVECLGSCDTAPVIRINDSYYEGMTVEKFDKIVESF